MKEKNRFTAKMISKLAMMTALSVTLLLAVRLPFPPAPFLVYDPADIPIYITAFAYGPIEGLLVTLVVCIMQAFLLGGDGLYGFVMHFIATGIVALIVGVLYKHKKTKKNAIKCLALGIIIDIAVMVLMNILVTPFYMGVERGVVIAMLPTVIIPFNFIKSGLNSILTFLLYKHLSKFLHNV